MIAIKFVSLNVHGKFCASAALFVIIAQVEQISPLSSDTCTDIGYVETNTNTSGWLSIVEEIPTFT